MSIVLQLQRRARSHVSSAMVVWSLVMTVVLIAWEASPSLDSRAFVSGFGATLVFGVYLGWQRRSAAVFVAPMVSWTFAWLPVWVTAMFRHGLVKGFVVGFFLVTFGWLVIGTLEFLTLGGVNWLVRVLRGGRRRSIDDGVTVFGPGERP